MELSVNNGVYVLMPNKNEDTYSKVLSVLKDHLPGGNVKQMVVDFESTFINAFGQLWNCHDVVLQYLMRTNNLLKGSISEKGYLDYKKANLKTKNLTKMENNLTKINWCYCNGDCNPSGLINITSCFSRYPVFVGFPYVYKADPTLNNLVIDMRPTKENHS
ncbi:hypothetical protein M0804_014511 [Polistes exclamans]|nr:hypothetical protein M0804_014511 [Polistes exclamans]